MPTVRYMYVLIGEEKGGRTERGLDGKGRDAENLWYHQPHDRNLLSFTSFLSINPNALPPSYLTSSDQSHHQYLHLHLYTHPPSHHIHNNHINTNTNPHFPSLPPYHHSHYCHRNKQNTQNKVQAALRSKLDEAISVKRSQVETVSPWAFVAFFRYLAMVQVMWSIGYSVVIVCCWSNTQQCGVLLVLVLVLVLIW